MNWLAKPASTCDDRHISRLQAVRIIFTLRKSCLHNCLHAILLHRLTGEGTRHIASPAHSSCRCFALRLCRYLRGERNIHNLHLYSLLTDTTLPTRVPVYTYTFYVHSRFARAIHRSFPGCARHERPHTVVPGGEHRNRDIH